MCFDFDSMPPELPVALLERMGASLPPGLAEGGAAAFGQDLTLTSQDGTQFAAFEAHPDAPNGAGVVILPDIRGLYRFYKELAVRFAVAGVEAIAIDYFGRTAGLTPRDDDFDYMPHVRQTRPEAIAQDVAAAIDRLRATPGTPIRAIFTAGFCFGGSQSFFQAASQRGLAGVIGFYGAPARSLTGGPTPLDLVGQFTCPVLGLFGGADQGIPVDDVNKFDAALAQAGVDHEVVIYPGAPHSFFDRRYTEFQEASADAWQRMLTFIGQRTPQATQG